MGISFFLCFLLLFSQLFVRSSQTAILLLCYTYNETTGRFATLPGRITVPAATFAQDTETGAWVVTPGVTQLVVTGTV